MLQNARHNTTNNGGYKMSYDNEYDEYGVDWVRILNNKDRELLDKVKGILNKNLTGEEYIQFNDFVDKLEEEFDENQKEQKIFNETKSSGLDLGIDEDSYYAHRTCHYRGEVKNATDLYRDWRRDGWFEKHLFNDRVEVDGETKWVAIKDMDYETASKKIKEYLLDKHRANNENPLYDIGKSLDLFRDYWGNWKSFSGQLKPIDVASYMTQICTLVGEYLCNTYDKGIGGYDGGGIHGHKSYQPPTIDEQDIDWFIEDWNADEKRTRKFPTNPKKEEV